MTESTLTASLSDIEKHFPILLGLVPGDRTDAAEKVNSAFKQIDIYRKTARKKSLVSQQALTKQ